MRWHTLGAHRLVALLRLQHLADEIQALLNAHGHIIRPRANFSHRGYAFINLSNPAHARLFLKTMSGLRATSAGCCSPSSSFPW